MNAYGKDNSLYPTDPRDRALVDQRLFFNVSVLYKAFSDAYVSEIEVNDLCQWIYTTVVLIKF